MRAVLIFTLTLAILTPAFAADDRERLDAALKAFGEGDATKAIGLLEEIPAKSKLRPKADYLAGEARLLLGDPEKAELLRRLEAMFIELKSLRELVERLPAD